ncbi:3-keto-disaccharide hydrolase [Salinimonas lutimaris]|uniref:3-keto-disaccharide hydrolase n=1 Tax=Salinimonas lutimaris TaxID=914153 RepID=UPI0010BF8C6C|nr:DUF1080 domain-containing protein [Salinimonas lutimaris]
MKQTYKISSVALAVAMSATAFSGQIMAADDELEDWQKAEKTEVWEPVPPKITANAGEAPSDAIVLFDGTDLSAWESVKGGEANWTVKDGVLTVKPGTGDIKTKQSFCDVQLHVEWRAPKPEADMEGQQRNNSGVFLQQRYEVQVLDSFESKTYANGQAASVYKQSIPLVNATRPPEQWQEYDIIFNAPRFDGEKLMTPATITVLHNGVLVQNHYELKGKTEWIGEPSYEAHGCAPIQLQDHTNEVSFRNIWVREITPLK